MAIKWCGLVAPEEVPTGDRRMFKASALGFRSFPLRASWKRVSGSGHSGAVVVGSWDREYVGSGGVWGAGEFLDPRIVPEVTEAIYLLEKRLIGPSVDLDPDLAYEVVPHPSLVDEFAMQVTRATVNGVTFVQGPAFSQVHVIVDSEEEMAILASAGITIAEFSVNSKAWSSWPVAERETPFDADEAIARIAAWSGGDSKRFAQAFLWRDDSGNPDNRETYRLPLADVVNDELVLIPRAVMSAATIMSGAHGGLYDTVPENERGQIQQVLTNIYDRLREDYGDPRFIAPWQRGGRAGATSSDGKPTEASLDSLDFGLNPDDVDQFQSRLGGKLEDYWVRGEGAAKIRWGTEGSFDRCVRALRKHFPQDTEGLCANLHHEATGKWPAEGKNRGEHSLDSVTYTHGVDGNVAMWPKANHPTSPAPTAPNHSAGADLARANSVEPASTDASATACHCLTSPVSNAQPLSNPDRGSEKKSDAIPASTNEKRNFSETPLDTVASPTPGSGADSKSLSFAGFEPPRAGGESEPPTGATSSVSPSFSGNTLSNFTGSKVAGASSASGPSNFAPGNSGQPNRLTSITVTPRAESVDSSAPRATGGLVPSSTTLNLLNEQVNTFATELRALTSPLSNFRSDPSAKFAAPLKPPGEWFQDPKLRRATPITVTEDGRVFGTLAPFGQCHMGVGNKCVVAPRSKTGYKHFKQGSVLTAEGRNVRVGKITIGTGHADKSFGVIPAVEHYDHTGTCVAVVNAGEDRFGVWVAGALVADVSEQRVAELRRSPLSGDWRRVDGNLELVAALAVNSPGFPVLDEDGDGAYSLLAAGVLEPSEGEGFQTEVNPLAEVDAYLGEVSRADRVGLVEAAYHDLLPDDCGCMS